MKDAIMNFPDAIKAGFTNWIDFSGRATRSEYWYFTLFLVLTGMVTGIVDIAVFKIALKSSSNGPITNLVSLLTFIPMLSLSVRRFHDIDKSGWWYIGVLIPIIGWIVGWNFMVARGTEGDNRFGDDPLSHEPLDLVSPWQH
jgi:uncharacterized membrane protein YhaH (DUF805 family)